MLRNSPLRRTASVAAGVLLGLTGVAFLAGPASAHHTNLGPSSPCVNEDGTWQVTWTAQNSQSNMPARITDLQLTPAGSELSVIAKDAELPPNPGTLVGVQKLPADAEKAEISLTAFWDYPQGQRDVTKTDTSSQVKPSKKCKPAEETTPPPSDEVTPPPSDEATPPAEETTPPPAEGSTPPASSPTPTPSKTTTAPPATPAEAPAEPEFVYDADCDSVTVGITVPADWKEDVVVTFKTSNGDSETITGKRGETTTVEFPATDGMKVTGTPKGYEDEAATITYDQPADCDNGGSGGGDNEPQLPLTGAAAGSIAVGAVVLLGAGIALFVVARRRKVKFTA